MERWTMFLVMPSNRFNDNYDNDLILLRIGIRSKALLTLAMQYGSQKVTIFKKISLEGHSLKRDCSAVLFPDFSIITGVRLGSGDLLPIKRILRKCKKKTPPSRKRQEGVFFEVTDNRNKLDYSFFSRV